MSVNLWATSLLMAITVTPNKVFMFATQVQPNYVIYSYQFALKIV